MNLIGYLSICEQYFIMLSVPHGVISTNITNFRITLETYNFMDIDLVTDGSPKFTSTFNHFRD